MTGLFTSGGVILSGLGAWYGVRGVSFVIPPEMLHPARVTTLASPLPSTGAARCMLHGLVRGRARPNA
ncbi:hypothetical protein M2175_001131 [Bradyrhizobium elkanii]|nr:hypothetical protein [Bradyrhizobium elkanii]MCS3966652.1 hypothetical protein [Bradyrhizobium japonicum]